MLCIGAFGSGTSVKERHKRMFAPGISRIIDRLIAKGIHPIDSGPGRGLLLSNSNIVAVMMEICDIDFIFRSQYNSSDIPDFCSGVAPSIFWFSAQS